MRIKGDMIERGKRKNLLQQVRPKVWFECNIFAS
jgi:hypothetical protein